MGPDALAVMLLDGAPRLLGISGLQGSGKSTVAVAMARLAGVRGMRAVSLSLDDFYLDHDARMALGREVHPLLATRGVPGTHDLHLLLSTLDALVDPSTHWPLAVPRFDKGRDDRMPREHWQQVDGPPGLVVFEGWCLGVPPQDDTELAVPVNELERDEDADGRWRNFVNAQLGAYAAAWARIDRLAVLQAPGWNVVRSWRGQGERKHAGAPRAMNDNELDRFLSHYERISRHALRTLPARADVLVALDTARTPVRITRR
ncbi:kinase [Pinirhizobacter sp.]|jgi:D-glycerate 3-kinase|uniref:kinase n=1 Tax=Pinirhizobacter sp. TaxID=2950432 RepID=UPI002F3F4DD0